MKPILALDGDGVLVDFTTPALKFMNLHGRIKTLADVTNWSVFDDDEEFEAQYKREIVAQPGFCRNMEPYPGAVEFGRAAQKEYTVMIVTSPYSVPHWYEGREDWMVANLGLSRRNVCFLSRKEYFDSDIFVDDKTENVQGWADRQRERHSESSRAPLPVLYGQPWNRDDFITHDVERVSSFQALALLLEEKGFPRIRGNF